MASTPYANPYTHVDSDGCETTIGPTTWPGHSASDVQRKHDEKVIAYFNGLGLTPP